MHYIIIWTMLKYSVKLYIKLITNKLAISRELPTYLYMWKVGIAV